MKKVLILFGSKSWKTKGPFSDLKYQSCYENLYSLASKNGVALYRASYQWYDHKNNIFKYAWTFKNGVWERASEIKPDLIYDKTSFRMETNLFKEKISENYPIINDPLFTSIADNKFITSLLFPEYSKRCYLLTSSADLKKSTALIKGTRIVLKPLSESGGKGVQIIHKKQLESILIKQPLLAQEFINSSNGIVGIMKGTHDLRTVFINNKLIYSYIRQPKKDSLLANLAQGGTMFIIKNNQLPKSIFPVFKKVASTFSQFENTVYTIDFMFDKSQKPWIIELNSMPGMYFPKEEEKCMEKTYLELIKLFKNA
ncbi:MAG: hypothetical protein COU40_01395 [Candidatus Moranbacteria bacterium CG10_big_fil_rev_8_21_14_0_10_35_21]|nr:MAG: hypothetical protein COU40_01395 [Candidatus Moranbacteria bacterium CG10_big_fil_rev_8_21_14_0_10_35_21]PJA88989.1 MAG: hypothetical protein CO139_00220 [Candidatus Moranbacteria bacterium CG_4_9_14_3_um_filter_36_9]